MSRLFKALSASALSIGLFGGLFYWGYALSNLDPHNVPVIRKVAGPARVAPVDPGGDIADYQGLTVNEVQAVGTAGVTSDRVVLAPTTGDLSDEDLAASALIEAVVKTDTSRVISEGIQTDEANLTFAAGVVENVGFVEGAEADAGIDPEAILKDAIAKAMETPVPVDMLRPQMRPKSLVTKVAYAKAEQPLKNVEAGTKLIQLGAFDSVEIAKTEWKKLRNEHGDLLGSKQQLVQKASSGGRQFYRLRAVGFQNADASRALCSALIARGTACIPVTAR